MTRIGRVERATKESSVLVEIDLDGSGKVEIDTGVPFYDHMLTAFGVHGSFDLVVRATGDVHIDAHHTVEDVAIVLGQAIRQALGDKAGIRRFASYLLPLDEALIQVALDLSGRPFLVYEVDTPPQMIGTFDPQLAEEFFRAFVTSAGITLHLKSLSGKNGHHMVEASFKGVARALRDAVRVEGGDIPSTKDVL